MSGLLHRLRFHRDHRFTMAHASKYLDGELGARGTQRVHDHTGFCPECRRMIESLRRTLDGLAGLRRRGDDRIAADVIARLRDDP